jgi:hypothetical protein
MGIIEREHRKMVQDEIKNIPIVDMTPSKLESEPRALKNVSKPQFYESRFNVTLMNKNKTDTVYLISVLSSFVSDFYLC